MAVLDTSILVSLLKDEPDAKKKIWSLREAGDQIFTTTITAYELLKGASISARPEENLAKVRDLLSTTQVLLLSLGTSEEAATIYKELREKGKMIGEFDILIAGIVRSNDEELVTRDAHFKSVKGLKVAKL